MPVCPGRLAADIETIGRFTHTPGAGSDRPTFSPAWRQARDFFCAEAERAGCHWRVDAAGNVHARPRGVDWSQRVWLSGSHLDSVPHGGEFDGVVGVVAALEVLRAAHEDGTPLRLRGAGSKDFYGGLLAGEVLDIAAYRGIVAYEPIIFPPEARSADPADNVLAQSAQWRRTSFDSFEAAIANFASKPPLMGFRADALEAYVRDGFARSNDGRVQLKCEPAVEAGTFLTGALHETWERLPHISADVLVVAGRREPFQPSTLAAAIAERLPHGRLLLRDELDHFGPMTHPHEMAVVVDAALA
jgi:pimeloyl-ACP methyl ester carboxylesterase